MRGTKRPPPPYIILPALAAASEMECMGSDSLIILC